MITIDQIIGSGATFPIKLNNGSWNPVAGDTKLIEDNLRSIIEYNFGQRIRQEDFGSRLWECLEEPNTSALSFLIDKFIRSAFNKYESRIKIKKVTTTRSTGSIHVQMVYNIIGLDEVNSMNISLAY